MTNPVVEALFPLTAEQRRAVYAGERDLAVRAGAGSGKTRVLVARAVHLLTRARDPLSLSSLLAITFTEKAAREMKERLAAALHEAGRRDMRADVEWAWVTTIHGFCARLLRENAVEASVDPAFSVLDEVQAETLLRGAVADVTAAWARERPGDVSLLGLLGVFDIEAEILDLFGRLRGAGRGARELPVPEPSEEAWRAAAEEIVRALESLPPLLDDAPEKSRAKARAALAHLPAVRARLAAGQASPETVETLAALRGDLSLSLSKDLKSVLKPLKEEVLPAAIRAAAGAAGRPVLEALRDFTGAVEDLYAARKRKEGALDFADLEIRALDLLEEVEEVRRATRGRFRQILVDEYQDVNPVQARILGHLRGEGNHFAVGDANQSIYGFRNAAPEIFRRYAEEVGEEGRVTLAANFRSSPGLVAFANDCFATLFTARLGREFHASVAAGRFGPAEGPEVAVLLATGSNAEEARSREAEALAARIREAVEAGEWTLVREGDRQGRPARFGDIAILFRAMTDVKTWERALEDRDIPYYVVKGRGFFQAREIVDLLGLARSVRNPRDEVALAATLRSPFAGLTEDGLLALVRAARARRDRNLAGLLAGGEVPGLPAEDAERWRRFVALHGDLRRLAGRARIREVLEEALARSGYATAVWLLPGGRRRAANLEKALGLADSLEDLCDLGEFLSVLEDLRIRETRETEAPTGGEAEDVVKLLTVHAAKGLEFPVVVVPDLCRASGGGDPGILFSAAGLAARVRTEPGGPPFETTLYRELRDDRRRREREEAIRLLYVAVTRAEERLVLCARTGRAPAGSWWEALSGVLAIDGEEARFGGDGRTARVLRAEGAEARAARRRSLLWPNRARLAAALPLSASDDADRVRAEALVARAERPRPRAGGSWYQNTVTELLLFGECPYRHHLRHRLGVPEVAEPAGAFERTDEPGGLDELPPREAGIAVHEVLRAFDPRGDRDLLEVARERVRPLAGGPAAEALAAQAAAMVRSFYEGEVGREVLAADPSAVRREVPFLSRWRTAERAGDDWGLILRGKIDLLYRRPDGGWRVVDYKTGGTPAGKYRIQLTAYARAVAGIVGEVRSAGLVYLASDAPARYEEVPLDPAAVEEVEEVARRFAAAMVDGGPFPRGPDADCRRCAYVGFCPEARPE